MIFLLGLLTAALVIRDQQKKVAGASTGGAPIAADPVIVYEAEPFALPPPPVEAAKKQNAGPASNADANPSTAPVGFAVAAPDYFDVAAPAPMSEKEQWLEKRKGRDL